MINNTYYTSSITSTTRNHLLLNNYSNETYPSSYCSCCCSFSLNTTKLLLPIPLNPSFGFVPRQSSLIHWPPTSRLLLGLGGGGYGFRGLGCDLGRSCFVESCCVRKDRLCGGKCCGSEKNVGVSSKKGGLYGVRGPGCEVDRSCFVECCCVNEDRLWGGKCCRNEKNVGVGNKKGALYGFRGPGCEVGRSCFMESRCVREHTMWDKCCGSEKNVGINNKKGRSRGMVGRSGYLSNAVGDMEAMLSLLAETVEVRLEGRENGRRVGEGGRVVEEHIVVCEKFDDGKNGRGDVGCLYSDNEVKKLGLGLGRGRVLSNEEGRKRREEEVERMPTGKDLRSRRKESCSSYYSLSDSGDFESDGEVEVQHEGLVGEASTSYGKDSRKVGGVVISEETKKDSKGYSDKRDQLLQSSIIVDHSKVGISTQWDCRKKSEKKLAVELAEEPKSKKDSVLQQSHSSKVSSSKKHFNRDERESTSGVNSHWQSWSRIKTNDQESAYSKSSSRHQQVTETNVNNAGTSSRKRSELGEGVLIVGEADQKTGCEFSKSCSSIMQENKSKTETLQHAEVSDSRDDGGWTVAGQGRFDNGLRKQENSSTSLQSSLRDTKQDQQTKHVSAGQVTSGRKSQYYDETIGTSDRYDESTLRTRRRVETRMKNLEEQSTSVVSRQEVKGLREEFGSKIIMENEARKTSQTGLSVAQDHPSNTEIGSQSASQQRLYDEQAFLASRLKSVEEAIAKQKQIEQRMLQSARKTDVQGHVQLSGFAGSSSKEASGTHPIVTVISQTGVQQLTKKVEGRSDLHFTNMERGNRSSSRQQIDDEQASLILRLESEEEEAEKQKQIEERLFQSTHETEVQGHVRQAGFAHSSSGEAIGSQPSVTVISQTAVQQVSQVEDKRNIHISVAGPSIGVVRDDSDKITGKVGTGAYVHPQIEFVSSSYDAHGNGGPSYEQSYPSDTLGSVARMEETSNHIVGEFVEKMRHDASTPDTRMEKTSSQLGSSNEDSNPLHEGSTRSDDMNTRLQKRGSRRSLGGSGTKGPSDEMWDVKDHFPQAPSEMEALDGATSEDSGPRRTGKSLWSVVTSVFRWGSHSETHKSSVKTSGQSSSNESASGQTWFSGNEHDEAKGDSLITEQSNMSEQSTSSDKLSLQRNATIGSENGTKRVEEDASSSSSVALAGLLSGGVAVGASTTMNVIQQTPQSTPSLELPIPPTRQFRRSDAFEEIEETGQNKGVVSSTKKQKEHVVSVRQSSDSSEGSDIELKQRMLQRSKQFQQERFEEWEDAYRCENEQRRVDEIFMREALVEAKKASDSWEVAVGAVLVQNGKVIARGYNLVEKLRDSTAHAEMICIRQASSVLKTWRLSETTLYVTLEPCPMCAGAILQARVGTVVWGAPNKLLGADGSWIRLFPEGPEGEQRPEVSDKPAAPVHPFHPKMKVRRGVLETECVGIMQQFFQLRRKKQKEEAEDSAHSSCLPVPHHPSFFHKILGTSHFLFCL